MLSIFSLFVFRYRGSAPQGFRLTLSLNAKAPVSLSLNMRICQTLMRAIRENKNEHQKKTKRSSIVVESVVPVLSCFPSPEPSILSTEESEVNLLKWAPKKTTLNPVSPARAVVLQNQCISERCHEEFMESLQNVKIKTQKGEKDRPAMQCLTPQVTFVGVPISYASTGGARSSGLPKINQTYAAQSHGLRPLAKLAKPTLVTWWLDPLYLALTMDSNDSPLLPCLTASFPPNPPPVSRVPPFCASKYR